MAKKYQYETTFTYLGKRYHVYANSEKELYTKMANKKRDLKDGVLILDSNTTVDTWTAKAYSVYKSQVKNLKGMQSRYDVHISPYIGKMPVSAVKSSQCQELLNRCAGMSFSHVNKLRQELRFIFDMAIENDMILKNPAAKCVLPEYYKGKRRSITDVEREHFYRVCEKDPAFNLFMLMLRCGCRPEEAINLQGRDIDHKQKIIHIRGTKSENADRYVPIPDDLYEIIKNVKGFSIVFPNRAGNKHTDKSYQRLTERLRREMNISMGCKLYRNALVAPLPLAEDFTPYCLRHTYCTDLCRAGVDVRVAQKLMGHSSISITANIYTHIDMDEIVKAGEKLNIFLNSGQKISKEGTTGTTQGTTL